MLEDYSAVVSCSAYLDIKYEEITEKKIASDMHSQNADNNSSRLIDDRTHLKSLSFIAANLGVNPFQVR